MDDVHCYRVSLLLQLLMVMVIVMMVVLVVVVQRLTDTADVHRMHRSAACTLHSPIMPLYGGHRT